VVPPADADLAMDAALLFALGGVHLVDHDEAELTQLC